MIQSDSVLTVTRQEYENHGGSAEAFSDAIQRRRLKADVAATHKVLQSATDDHLSELLALRSEMAVQRRNLIKEVKRAEKSSRSQVPLRDAA